MKYQFIEQHKHEFPVVVMCRVLEVSESGLYAWRQQPHLEAANEKMLTSVLSFERYLSLIKADMEVRVCMPN